MDVATWRKQMEAARNGQKVEQSPLYIACQGCGAPAEFDIIHQNYHCQHCGAHTDVSTTLDFVKKWREEHQHKLEASVGSAELPSETVSCSNCGAEVLLPAGEVTAKCDFCGGKLVRKEFNKQAYFPEIVIPFYITEQEAQAQLEKWLAENKDTDEAKIIQQHCKKLYGYYLPYSIVQGRVDCDVSRDGSERRYHCAGYIQNVAVNTSKQMDNSVLNAMEPFDWQGAKPFEYGYLAGQKAKMQDITADKLVNRTLSEVQEAYLPTIEKTMGTQGVDVRAHLSEDSWALNALLPAYVWQGQGLKVAINGQTGRVAVKSKKKIKTRPWYVEMLAWVLGLAVLLFVIFGVFVDDKELLYTIVGALTAFNAIVLSAVFHDNTRQRLKTKYLQSQAQQAERDKADKLVLHKVDVKETLVPQFVEKIKGKNEFVKLSFYSSSRITGLFAMVFLWNLAPALMAWAVADKVEYTAFAAWWCVSVPCSIIYFVKFARLDVFDFPIMQVIKPDGSLGQVVSESFSQGLKERLGGGLTLIMKILTVLCLLSVMAATQ